MGLSIIVDIDGTLSNPNHRRHLVEGENKNWEKFFEKVGEDGLNIWASQICNKFYNTHKVILVTGRPRVSKSGINVREKTLNWLQENEVAYDELYMRAEGDFRKDTVVKQEILDNCLPDPRSITMAVDDRKDIAEMWRSNGITCLQCKDEVEK